MIYLDTHVVVWLYVGDLSAFSPAATRALETDSLMISPVVAFERVITAAINQTWTRDPFDRIIVGHAAIQQCGLVTKDRIIHTHYAESIW